MFGDPPLNPGGLRVRVFTQIAHTCVMEPIVIKRLRDIHNLSGESDRRPELPICAQIQAFVRAADTVVYRFPKNNGTCIGNSIATYEVVAAFLVAVGTIVGRPSFGFLPSY